MNQGRVWCVVNPTVGLPLFLGSVAVISFTVHFAVLNNTTWVKDFFAGSTRASGAAEAAPVTQVAARQDSDFDVKVAPVAADGSLTVVLTPRESPPAQTAAASSQSSPGG
jgi:light-harvesting protein B-800-850 alpha chain